MAPLWWEMLFMMFIMSFLMFNIMIYYNKESSMMIDVNKTPKSNNLTWLW
uniref:ATP synthase F0 subunit 8 n=1 Tax=Dinorhynchus dybowskyi TaxID=2082689 RepID=A0A3G1NH28_9HEMI|nr:ATP synthase F0 subunit 8 [Dinorhynchus dybowskyi]AVA07530.1 ATP synthase F0 subunit 8 [Dinorhynchus dybowskyi]